MVMGVVMAASLTLSACRLVADRALVLLLLLRGKKFPLPRLNLIEARECVHVGKGMLLEAGVERFFGQRPRIAKKDAEIVDGLDGRAQRHAGKDHDRDAELLELGQAEARAHARLIVENRSLNLPAHSPHLVLARRALDEGHVSARLEVRVGSSDGIVETTAVRATRVRAS